MSQHNHLPDPSQPPPDDQLSAFLDGELPANEHARIERLIASDERYHQMADDLRQLQARLQSLPRYELPVDLSDRIRRQAERESLRPTVSLQKPAVFTHPGGRWKLAIIGAVAAIAAALLVMFSWPGDSQLAQHDSARHDSAQNEESQPARPMRYQTDEASLENERFLRVNERSGVQPSESSDQRGTQDAPASISAPQGPRSALGEPHSSTNLRKQMRSEGAAILGASPAEVTVDQLAESALDIGSHRAQSKSAPKREGTLTRELRTLDAHAANHELADEENLSHAGTATDLPPDLIVLVHVAGPSSDPHLLDEILVRNGIRYDDAEDRSGGKVVQRNRDEKNDPLALPPPEKDAAPRSELKSFADDTRRLADLVYVSASRSQIAAILQDLQRNPDQFLNVTVRTTKGNQKNILPETASEALEESNFDIAADLDTNLSASDDSATEVLDVAESEESNIEGDQTPDEATRQPQSNPRMRGQAKRLNADGFRWRPAHEPLGQESSILLEGVGVQQEWNLPQLEAAEELEMSPRRSRSLAPQNEPTPSGPDRTIRVLFLVDSMGKE